MEKYLKSEAEYGEAYDRRSIRILKKIEKDEHARRARMNKKELFADNVAMVMNGDSFHDQAVKLRRARKEWIEKQIETDARKDKLVTDTLVPLAPRCAECSQCMIVTTHLFEKQDREIQFVFECPDGHAGKRALYADGTELVFEKPVCIKCESEQIKSSRKKAYKKTVFTDTCKACGHVEIFEMPLLIPDAPIDPEDLQKYCEDYIYRKTKVEDIRNFNKVMDEVREETIAEKVKQVLELDKIEKPTIHQLQQKIIIVGAGQNFVSLQLDKPELLKDTLVVGFTIQDSSENRKDAESLATFETFLNDLLLATNWRVVKKSIEYRLGYLTGKLQGFEKEIDLEKIAKEMIEAKSKKS